MTKKLYNIVLCTCARMEEDSIIEWILYHNSIGVEHFYIYGNDDDKNILIDALSPVSLLSKELVTFIHCPIIGAQRKMYQHFINNFSAKSNWCGFIDQDEYIRIEESNNDICKFIEKYSSEFDSIQLNWLNYGTSNFKERPKGSVLKKYTLRSTLLDVHTKHISKSSLLLNESLIQGPFWHSLSSSSLKTCLSNGSELSFWNYLTNDDYKNDYQNFVIENNNSLIKNGCIAHYCLKSESDFQRRIQRSLSGEFSGQAIYQHYLENPEIAAAFINQRNEEYDPYLSKYWLEYTKQFHITEKEWSF